MTAILIEESSFQSDFNFVNLKVPKLEVKMAEKIGDDQVLSLQEVIEEEESLEATANAVLGPGDDQNCTYPNVMI